MPRISSLPAPDPLPRQQALLRIATLAATTEDPHEAATNILDAVLALFPGCSGSLELINPDTKVLEIESCRGEPSLTRSEALRPGEGLAGWVALHGKAARVDTIALDARCHPGLPAAAQAALAAPMRVGDEAPVGVLLLVHRQAGFFTPASEACLVELAELSSQVLGRLWRLRQLRLKSGQLHALVNTGRLFGQSRDLSELPAAITREVRAIMHCRVSSLYLLDETGERLVLEAASGPEGMQAPDETLDLFDSSLGTAVRRQRPVEVHDVRRTEEHHFVQVVQRQGLVSLLCCPLLHEGRVLGVLNAYTDHIHRFNNEERRLLETLAGLAAVAIQNARLYARIFQSEETLRKTERLTTLGLLSAEIAHEIRNPLTVIRLLFESLDLRFAESDVRSKDTAIISEKLDQLEGIVSRVLSVGKSREDLKQRADLGALVEDTLHLVRLKFQQSHIDVDYVPCGQPLGVEVSKGQIQQAILNLLINASQAMPEGGRIRIHTRGVPREGQACAEVDIEDTGGGVPEGIRHQIFDSFLSGHAHGTGLGLSIVKRILRSHDGDIELAATGPAGTTMRVWLPLAESIR